MCDTSVNENRICRNCLNIFPRQSHSCEICKRTSRIREFLNQLTIASKAKDYTEEIPATVAVISAVSA
jgi:RNA polymerase subunit RPABC4/transcription elongation factor Spt4